MNDMSVAFMVVDAPDGVSTAVSSRGFGRGAVHVRFERDGGAGVGRGLLDHRVDDRAQRVRRFHGEVHHAGAGLLAVGHRDLDARPVRTTSDPALKTSCPSARVDTVTWSVFCGGCRHRASADRRRGRRSCPTRSRCTVAPCSTSISGGVSLCSGAWSSPPASVSDHGGAGRLPAPVGNLIAERHRCPRRHAEASSCRYRPSYTGETLMFAPSGALTDVMRSTEQSVCSSLRKHVEDLLRSRARAERIVHGLDLPRLRRAGSC